MATSIVSFKNEFADGTNSTLQVGPIDTTAINANNIRTRVKAVNQDLGNSDTSVYSSYMAGKYGGQWTRISEAKIKTTTRIYLT